MKTNFSGGSENRVTSICYDGLFNSNKQGKMEVYISKKIMHGKKTVNYIVTALFLLLLSSLTPVNAYQEGEIFRDCATCPEMVVLPAGEFIMGSPKGEIARRVSEGPQRWVTIPNPFAVGKYEVTVGQFAEFVQETNHSTGYCGNKSKYGSWRNPSDFKQTNNHPVVCVNWDDASAYADWLSAKTGHEYRLLSEAEWEYAVRAGTNTAYHFGRVISSNQAQYAREGTAAVGSFPTNAFGLYDMHGNVWEWVQDCLHPDYTDAPTDGSAWIDFCRIVAPGQRQNERYNMLRGGSWVDGSEDLRSASRGRGISDNRAFIHGFRVARTFTYSDSSSFSKTIDWIKDLVITSDTPQGKTFPSDAKESLTSVDIPQAELISRALHLSKHASRIRNNHLMEVKAELEKARDLSDNDQTIKEIDDAIQELQRIIDLKDLKMPVNTPDTANLIEDISELNYPYEAGKTFRDCATCPVMIVLPAGEFTMGSPEGETGRYDVEGPQREVTIPNFFAVGKYEVTVAQFVEFLKEKRKHKIGDCDLPEDFSWYNPGFKQTDNHPIVCVNWHDASGYADWLSKKTSHEYRLLTEAEWEYAARSGTTTAYYFGKVISDDHAQYAGSGTAAVGSFPANAFGLHDMHGNVWEWVQDCFHPDYTGAPTDGSAWLSSCYYAKDMRILRGGSWDYCPVCLRSANRYRDFATVRGDLIGFRVARTLNP